MLTSCGNHFSICLSQVITLYTFNLHSAVCQFHLSEAEREKYRERMHKHISLNVHKIPLERY